VGAKLLINLGVPGGVVRRAPQGLAGRENLRAIFSESLVKILINPRRSERNPIRIEPGYRSARVFGVVAGE
jgi:hypothetical protein